MIQVAPNKRRAIAKKLTSTLRRKSPAAPEKHHNDCPADHSTDPAKALNAMELLLDISGRLQVMEHYIQSREHAEREMPQALENQEDCTGPRKCLSAQ